MHGHYSGSGGGVGRPAADLWSAEHVGEFLLGVWRERPHWKGEMGPLPYPRPQCVRHCLVSLKVPCLSLKWSLGEVKMPSFSSCETKAQWHPGIWQQLLDTCGGSRSPRPARGLHSSMCCCVPQSAGEEQSAGLPGLQQARHSAFQSPDGRRSFLGKQL